MSLRRVRAVGLLLPLLVALSCSSPAPEPKPRIATIPAPAPEAQKPVDYPGLHNVVTYSEGLMSGSAPEGPGLETLADMGVRTIVSVDGAQPDVDEARALGLRYVHLPIGYDGMTEERKLELARAVRDLPGPIYVHCHHGKHRSAAAAAAISVSLGKLSNDAALARMKVSGTAPNYTGLYACATDTKLATDAQITAASHAFPSRWKTTGLVQSMVEIDAAFDHLKAVEQAKWAVPADHPDLVPAAEAGRIAHLLRELSDTDEVRRQGQEFETFRAAGEKAANELEDGFLKGLRAEDLGARLKAVSQDCKDCHAKFRD